MQLKRPIFNNQEVPNETLLWKVEGVVMAIFVSKDNNLIEESDKSVIAIETGGPAGMQAVPANPAGPPVLRL